MWGSNNQRGGLAANDDDDERSSVLEKRASLWYFCVRGNSKDGDDNLKISVKSFEKRRFGASHERPLRGI